MPDPASILDLVLGAAALELVVLLIWLPRSGSHLRPRDVLPNLFAGLALLIALRLVVAGAAMYWWMLMLVVAMAAHVVDLRGRWYR